MLVRGGQWCHWHGICRAAPGISASSPLAPVDGGGCAAARLAMYAAAMASSPLAAPQSCVCGSVGSPQPAVQLSVPHGPLLAPCIRAAHACAAAADHTKRLSFSSRTSASTQSDWRACTARPADMSALLSAAGGLCFTAAGELWPCARSRAPAGGLPCGGRTPRSALASEGPAFETIASLPPTLRATASSHAPGRSVTLVGGRG